MIPSDFLIVLIDNEHWYSKSCKEAPDYKEIEFYNFDKENTFLIDDIFMTNDQSKEEF